MIALGLLAILALAGRVRAAGELDPDFGTGGKATFEFLTATFAMNDVLVTSDDTIVMAGASSIDPGLVGFGTVLVSTTQGVVSFFAVTQVGTSYGSFATVVQADDKLVAAGAAQDGGGFREGVVVRYVIDGTLDTTFGTTGIVRTPLGSADGGFTDVLLDPDGNLVTVGSVEGEVVHGVIARYLPTGALDPAFGSGGITRTDLGDVRFNGVARQADGKLVAVGSVDLGATEDVVVVRFDADGTIDTTFGGGDGIVITPVGTENDVGTAVLVQPDDRIVVSATVHSSVFPTTEKPTLIRYLPDGTLDGGFASGGMVMGFLVGSATSAEDVLRQPDGKLVVAGRGFDGTYNGFAIMRFRDDGTPDATFGAGGGTFAQVGQTSSFAFAVAQQADNKLVVAGNFPVGPRDYAVVARFIGDDPPPSTTSTTTVGPSTTTVFPTTGHSTSITTSTSTSTTTSTTSPGCSCASPCEVCDGVLGCHVPDVAGCVQASAHKASLVLRDDPNPARDRVTWKWKSGTAVALGDFGSPTTTDAYALCVFDRPGGAPSGRLVLQVSAGGTCGTRPCWKSTSVGYKYNDPSMAADGVRTIQLKSGEAGRAKTSVKGKGSGLAMPGLGFTTPVTARLVRIDTGACWESTFAAPIRNDATTFKAKSD
jgi:uncharacterized delta-60 repeat protein